MPYDWPEETDFALWELDVLERNCPTCGRMMHVCDHRYRRFHTLQGPVELLCRLDHCPDPHCPGHAKTKSPETEVTIALPKWAIAWDVFCWIGHRRCSRHMAIPTIRSELLDDYAIKLSENAIDTYIRRYQIMLAARQHDPESLRRHYAATAELILCIDGLQPEKGHETLYVVRELTGKRVWFAEPLLPATAAEARRLIVQAREWAEALGKPVALWLSDKQDAFVTGSPRSSPTCPIATATTTSSATWPSRSRTPIVMPRSRCARRSAACGRSNSPCWRGRRPSGATTPRRRILKSPSRRPRRRRTRLLPRSIPPTLWCSSIARWCVGSSMTIKGGRCILPAYGWPRR